MYGWIEIDENNLIKKISVKKKWMYGSHIVIGTFTFKYARTGAQHMCPPS